MIEKKIRETILTHALINPGEHIVLGLSGGPDSVCLFHVLKKFSSERNFSLYTVHVNHQFRPGEAEADQAYVEELCRKEGVPCAAYVYDCCALAQREGLSSEEAGRKARYQAFKSFCASLAEKGIGIDKIKIAVAQNADDQAETVLLRLLRGSGTDGLAGMAYIRSEGTFPIIRPLLDVPRKEIETYCKTQNLRPRIDRTNLQPIYTRNKVRLHLIPYLRENFNPNITEALLRLSKAAREDKDYLWFLAEQAFKDIEDEDGALDLEGLRALTSSIRHRVIMKAFEKAGLWQDITAVHLDSADRLLAEGKASGTLDFPKGYKMKIQYGKVYFFNKETMVRAISAMPDKKETEASLVLKYQVIEPLKEYPKDAAVFDWNKLKAQHDNPEFLLRTRMPGDYICLKKGRKKMQDFFVDAKIPKEHRDEILLVTIGSEVLWIIKSEKKGLLGHRYSEKYKLDHKTKKALLLEIVCEM